ncbi:unnamed protein product [Camellia sinensis]
MINGLCMGRLLDEASELLMKMEEEGCSPDFYLYNILVQGFLQNNGTQKALQLLHIMDRAISVDPCTVTLLVKLLSNDGLDNSSKEMLHEVPMLLWFSEMVFVIVFTRTNFNMDGYCLCGQVDEARKMFDVMVSRGCAPNVFTYNILINGYCKIKNIDEAMNLFKEMSRKGLLPDTITYTTLIGGMCQTRRPQDALLLLMRYGLCNNQRLNEALALFEKIEKAGLVPDIVVYNNLIEGMCKAGKLNDARKLCSSRSAKGFKPTISTYNIMIARLCKGRLPDEANKLLMKMEEEGCSPDFYSYNLLVQGFL